LGYSVNSAGQVAGVALTPDLYGVGFRTGPYGLGLGGSSLLGLNTQATGINASGQVTGKVLIGSTSVGHAFRTSATGIVSDPGTDLGVFAGGLSSEGWGINSNGQVTGSALLPSGNSHAFRTTATGLVSDPGADLGVLPGAVVSFGRAINDSGHVVGISTFPGFTEANGGTGTAHAFRTTATGLVSDPGADLGTLGGTVSSAYGINAAGEVVGASKDTAGHLHAFRTTPTGLVSDPGTDLGVFPGGTQSSATAINAQGVIVGSGDIAGGASHAFVYTDQMSDLNNLITPGTGWTLRNAYGINDDGWITGEASMTGGGYRGYLLIPIVDDPGVRTPIVGVPEPSTVLLVGGGGIVIPWIARRRSRTMAA
jgi:probable HAF family extracellular repeat protein